MLRRILFCFWLAPFAFAQPVQVVLPQPDCQIIINLTALNQTTPTAPNAGFNNIQGGCSTWAMTAAVSGFSSATVALQSAPNVAGVPGAWSTFAGTIFSPTPHNANPIVTATQDFVWSYGYNPWVRVQLTAVTGTGVVNGIAYGWRIPSATSNSTGGGSAVTIAGPLGQALMAASIPVVIASNQSTLNTIIPANGTVIAGQQAVTGTAAALGTNTTKNVCLKALIANTINVYVGPSGVTISNGLELAPGQAVCEPLANTNLFFVVASTTGASVSWIATN